MTTRGRYKFTINYKNYDDDCCCDLHCVARTLRKLIRCTYGSTKARSHRICIATTNVEVTIFKTHD